jgi:hypothetical protein
MFNAHFIGVGDIMEQIFNFEQDGKVYNLKKAEEFAFRLYCEDKIIAMIAISSTKRRESYYLYSLLNDDQETYTQFREEDIEWMKKTFSYILELNICEKICDFFESQRIAFLLLKKR